MSDAYTDIAKETERALEIVRANNLPDDIEITQQLLKERGFVHTDTIVLSRECPR